MLATLILGASDKAERFSNRAQLKLVQQGNQVVLVNPKGGVINGIKCLRSLEEVKQPIDTVTVYINPSRIIEQIDQIIKLTPRRMIFNPGSESQEAARVLKQHKIEVVENCTLVMLDLNEY